MSQQPTLQCPESALWMWNTTSTLDGSSDTAVKKESTSSAVEVVANERVHVQGTLIGYNTLEAFQSVDKNQALASAFLPKFLNTTGDENSVLESLTQVVLLTYCDLKQHKVLYWFGFPTLALRSGIRIPLGSWQQVSNNTLPQAIHHMRIKCQDQTTNDDDNDSITSGGLPPYFLGRLNNETHKVIGDYLPLSKDSYQQVQGQITDGDSSQLVFGFFDPTASTDRDQSQIPLLGWPMRNLIAYLCFHLDLGGQTVSILSYRPKVLRRILLDTPPQDQQQQQHHGDHDSLLLTVQLPNKQDYDWAATQEETATPQYKVVGWELNARSKPGPRWVNLRPLLDTKHLAIQAADLNLKLMKWRMIPDLRVNQLQQTKVLIIGAGTLGCSVARVLLGWGIRHFVFVDNGKVSYSNPVRQSLFTLEDCHDASGNGGGRPKAVAAAEALQTIAADVESQGIVLSIPMPGHAEKDKESIAQTVETLDELVQDCDVVYLLTDTRESRWLPTVMAAAHDKMLINAALGLDSWLVMRHGGGCWANSSSTSQATVVDGKLRKRLGCYFCNDVVAPENSTRNRTLDQQCTVTRPGLAPIASSMAVELMVSLLHHPDGLKAPPPISSSNFSPTVTSDSAASASQLGVIPHQIRGTYVKWRV